MKALCTNCTMEMESVEIQRNHTNDVHTFHCTSCHATIMVET